MSQPDLGIESTALSWLQDNSFELISDYRPLANSEKTSCYLLSNRQRERIVAKISNDGSSRLLAEVDGLRRIATNGNIRTPRIHYSSRDCLLLEYLDEGRQSAHYWSTLAQQLAALHRSNTSTNEESYFGLADDNYCGLSLQCNGWHNDSYTFFSEKRLLYQARRAFDNGLLEAPWVIQIESICERLRELIPNEPPALLHGDLWGGNILVAEDGLPALIDPAVYYGWREADIAMTLMFGGLPRTFYQCYDDCWPMETGWRSRVPLYNLYHLLNHLNIFGESYLEAVQTTIARYA